MFEFFPTFCLDKDKVQLKFSRETGEAGIIEFQPTFRL